MSPLLLLAAAPLLAFMGPIVHFASSPLCIRADSSPFLASNHASHLLAPPTWPLPPGQVNLEYLLVDSRTFVTAEAGALRTFFGAAVDSSTSYRSEIEVMTARLATVFATLREMPAIRFRAATPPGEEFPPGLESRLLVAQRIAVELNERLAGLQRQGLLPERETCELVLTDRGVDPVAPVIHEWTYEAMAHDLLAGTPCLQVGAVGVGG